MRVGKPTLPQNTNFSMGGEKWGTPLFRPSDPIVWAQALWKARAKHRLSLVPYLTHGCSA